MAWVFALGIIALAVYNTGFRKVLLWGSPLWFVVYILFFYVPAP
jgi:hypothetical protein